MNKEQTKKVIIAIVAILLIVGGIYYYKNIVNRTLTPEQEVVYDENNLSTPLTKEEELKNKADLANSDELKAQEAVRKAKWETSMKNAQMAFGKGEYDKSIAFYNEALTYFNKDEAYSGLFVVYSAQNNIDKALIAIDSAIKINPKFTEYWKSKLSLLDDKTDVSFTDLKKVYEEGILKVDASTKINLVTHFAVIAEKNWQKFEAISLWEYAIRLYPDNKLIYQAEIDRLRK